MQEPTSINDLLRSGGRRLKDLTAQSQGRAAALLHVRAALPAKLAQIVVTAGLEHGRLTVGVTGSAWAMRLRYETDGLRMRVGGSMGIDIHTVRIKVVPPRAAEAPIGT